MSISKLAIATVLAAATAACGPLAGGPAPVVQGQNGPAAPGVLVGSGMGVGGPNGGMGNGGGVAAGGGPAVP